MTRFPLVLLLVVLLLTAGGARAANIALIRPAGSSRGVSEALFRLQGELLALGLEVSLVDRPPAAGSAARDAGAALAKVATEQSIDAMIDVIGDPQPTAVEVWIFERSPPRFRVSRVALEPADRNASEILAIRAIEVLRSNFVEIDLAAKERLPVLAPFPEPTEPPPGRVEQWGLEAGAAVVTGIDGIGPALHPLVRLDWAASSRWVAQATFAGLGTRPTLETARGRARVDQAYGLAGICYCSPAERGATVVLSVSAGALRTALEGQATAPAQGHSVEHWSLLLEASTGARLRVSKRYYLTLAFHAQLAQPQVVVHFADEAVATSGRPNLLLSITAGAWL